jgi:hypothetical protein
MNTTLQTLAREMSQAFENATRPGNGGTFRKLRDTAPEWMTTVCRLAHDDGGLLPDDWRYVFIEEAVDALAEHEDTNYARDSLVPDVYTSDLTAWLHSRNSRVYYLSEALTEWGPFPDGFQLLAATQMIEKVETFQQVVDALQNHLDGQEQGDQP